MEEYCILPRKMVDRTFDCAPASQPADSKHVLSFSNIVREICDQDMDDWKKATKLQSTLERYLALIDDGTVVTNRQLLNRNKLVQTNKSV